MRKIYSHPSVTVEEFVANDVITSCLQVELTCAIPGRSSEYVGDGTSARDNHGLCGNTSTTFVNDSTGSGYERVGGVTDYQRPISNVTFGKKLTGYSEGPFYNNDIANNQEVSSTGYYFAKWNSTDNRNNTGTYSHYGLAHVTDIDSNRPNHS